MRVWLVFFCTGSVKSTLMFRSRRGGPAQVKRGLSLLGARLQGQSSWLRFHQKPTQKASLSATLVSYHCEIRKLVLLWRMTTSSGRLLTLFLLTILPAFMRADLLCSAGKSGQTNCVRDLVISYVAAWWNQIQPKLSKVETTVAPGTVASLGEVCFVP